MNIAIVIPCLNEEVFISTLLSSIYASIDASDAKDSVSVYLCDNGSTDNTLKIAREFAESNNLVVLHEPERGDGAAMATAACRAFQHVEWVISVDADCIVNRAFVNLWLESIENSQDPVLTGFFRFPNHFRYQFPIANELLSELSDYKKKTYFHFRHY